MNNDKCERCVGRLIEIDHYGERLKGCPTCNNTGYKGRTGLYEVMEVDEDIKEAGDSGSQQEKEDKYYRNHRAVL